METSELIKKVRKIEIKSKGLSNQIFSGEYHSAFKGRGMTFSEVREYMYGDSIRTIDWNVTARFNHPYVKVFEEERELTVMLLVDFSGSSNFGSRKQSKKELIAEICAVLAFSAIKNNDKIGVIFFTDEIEKFIPPKKGRTHILRIIRELLEFEPKSTKTDVSVGLKYLSSIIKKRSTAFVLSDFMDQRFEKALKITNQKHDVIALQIADPLEQELPDVGLIEMLDNETGEINLVDTSDEAVRNNYKATMLKFVEERKVIFKKSNVDVANINTQHSYIKPLMNLFKRRESKR